MFQRAFFWCPPQKKNEQQQRVRRSLFEGLVTFLMFPVLVGLAFAADKGGGLGSCHRGRRIIPRDLDQPQPEKPKEFLVGNLPWIFFGESNPFWPGFSNFERFFSGFFFSKGGDFCFGNHKSQRIFRFSIHMHRKFRGKVSKVAFDIFLELQPTSFFNECFVKQQFPG